LSQQVAVVTNRQERRQFKKLARRQQMVKVTLQQVMVQASVADGKVKANGITYQCAITFKKGSGPAWAFTWTPSDEDKDAIGAILQKGYDKVLVDEGLAEDETVV
jgi:hypothetical protein